MTGSRARRRGKWVVQSWKYDGTTGEYGRECRIMPGHRIMPGECMSFLKARDAMEWMEGLSASSTASSGVMFQVSFREGDYKEDRR